MTERRYQMTRLAKGDYLLPSNDLQTLWRISSYEEDGSAIGTRADGTEYEITGTFWQAARYVVPLQEVDVDRLVEDVDDWERWSVAYHMERSRAAAIEAALSARV